MFKKEQVLYFFLQGKISLSQYDYKFMANLQTLIQDKNRVTSNQAILFDNLISKYKKQLTKNGYDIDTLKSLTWETIVVESTPEYTGAMVSLYDDTLVVKVPFNKVFISKFRDIKNNSFEWDKDTKTYRTIFSTTALKIATTELPKHFTTVRFDDQLSNLLDEINAFQADIYNPTLTMVNGRPTLVAINSVLGELTKDMDLKIDGMTLFKLSRMGITIDSNIYQSDRRLEFASQRLYEAEMDDIELVIGWMKNLGCQNVVIGRGLSYLPHEQISKLIEKYGMNSIGPMRFGALPDGINMLLQHTSSVSFQNAFKGDISKTVVLKNSRPIEVK